MAEPNRVREGVTQPADQAANGPAPAPGGPKRDEELSREELLRELAATRAELARCRESYSQILSKLLPPAPEEIERELNEALATLGQRPPIREVIAELERELRGRQ